MKGDLEKLLMELTSKIASKEHVAGDNDDGEVERILTILEGLEKNLVVRKIRFPLISWKLKEAEVEPKGKFSLAPYVEDFDIEGTPYFLSGDPSDPLTWRGFPQDRVAIAKEPENPDEVKAAALLGAEAGAKALLVHTEDFTLRKIVTTGSWGYSYHSGSPTPIPVIYIDKSIYEKIKNSNVVRVYVRAETRRTSGIIVEIDSGWDVGRPLFGAHYDRWFLGFQDDSLGVVQAFLAWREASRTLGGARLIIFSAEEHGAPGYAGWYWSWGSRWYVRQLEKAEVIEGLGPYVNFDVAGSEPLTISGSPQLVCKVLDLGVRERCCECPECDSFSFATAGVETISLHSLWSPYIRRIYHTPLDRGDRADIGVAARAIRISLKALEGGEAWNCYESKLREWLGSSGLLARRAFYIIESIARRVGWSRVYRELSRRFLKAINYGDYRWSSGDLEAIWFPEVVIYKRIIDDIDKGRSPPLEVWVSGEERLIYSAWISPKRSRAKEMVVEQAYENLKRMNDIIEDIKEKLLS
jgi:Iap family predicted aminopeptidase